MNEPDRIAEWDLFEKGNAAAIERAEGPIDFTQPLKVYWLPGCSGCLRMKEFLNKHGVKYISVNPLVDKQALEELAAIGVRRIPIAARGKHWADGQILKELAWIAGIELGTQKQLSPPDLARRADRVMTSACNLIAHIPDRELALQLPQRPRSYRQLACHIFQIYGLFLELVEDGRRMEFAEYFRDAPPDIVTSADVVRFGGSMRARFAAWWRRAGETTDFHTKADVYYGDHTMQTLHDFLERTVWHSAHHTRQLQAVVQKLGFDVANALTAADLAGLPLPDETYDDTVRLS